VARFYADSHVSYATLALLSGLGHQSIRCQNVGMANAKDYRHLLRAADYGAILLTHDRGFQEWHAAWRIWSDAWSAGAQHAGIIIFPNDVIWSPMRAAEEIDRFVRSGAILDNRCYSALVIGVWESVEPEEA
jgi:uncharacterized protein DUF5615